MKTLSLLFIFSFSIGWSQSGEFSASKSGLIYSDNAVAKLKHIVDSLNLKFKTCDYKQYYTIMQGKGTYLHIQGANALKVKNAIEAGTTPEKIGQKYSSAEIAGDLLVIKSSYKDYDESNIIIFQSIGLNDKDYELSFEEKLASGIKSKNKGWVFSYHKKTKYSEEYLDGFYLEGLTSKKLKDNYARLVQYSDCLVDTTATVYVGNAKNTGVRYSYENRKMIKFLTYLNDKMPRPRFSEGDFDKLDTLAVRINEVDTTTTFTGGYNEPDYMDYAKKMEVWESARLAKVDSLMANDRVFKGMFEEVYKDAVEGKEVTNDEFEEYVARYSSKEQALKFKRSRRVIGGCSMDDSPRVHAMNIAELAAETAKWEIFLRSHLDIMNDRFDRVSDGSYAQQGRKTYIKELEVLDINVNDLLLGISLRVQNAADNHYFGSIGRIGRSLAEAKDRPVIEDALLKMIADKELDDYNRVLLYWLFRNYNRNLDDEKVIAQNNSRLREAIAYMPGYLSNGVEIK